MTSLTGRFAADISLEYSLIDKMRVRGHLMHLQSVGMLSVFFKRWRNVSWIEPRDLQQVTDEFVNHVETMAEKNHIPLLSSKPMTFANSAPRRACRIYPISFIARTCATSVCCVGRTPSTRPRWPADLSRNSDSLLSQKRDNAWPGFASTVSV